MLSQIFTIAALAIGALSLPAEPSYPASMSGGPGGIGGGQTWPPFPTSFATTRTIFASGPHSSWMGAGAGGQHPPASMTQSSGFQAPTPPNAAG